MAQQFDDVCLVCADPLEFTAFGLCGHNEVCSRCVSRMRFVLKDKGCVFCRQECPSVYFTRFNGDYTTRLTSEAFGELKARADRRELHYLPEVDGYFDDEKHFQEMRALCGFAHPILQSAGKSAPRFNNFPSLKKHIETTFNQFFCDTCVKGRKIFVSEQLLYNKDALRRHMDSGDESGPLAESGFKGHPPCKFCRTRFFDPNELYRHMESSHEHCFLCRRAAPDKYVYYRHYKELEEHFQKDHHPCPHPDCLERKFVVFSTDYELKAHFASDHGDSMKMSAAQRRQALTIPLPLQYRTRDDEDMEPGASAHLERAAVIIGGGGQQVNSRFARRGRGPQAGASGSGMHHSRSEPQMAAAGGDGPEAESVSFTAADFPAPSQEQLSAAGPLGRWAAFAGSQSSMGNMTEQEFPALPSLSKNQRRRLKDQQRTLAERLSAAAQPPRVLNRAGPTAGPGPSSAAAYSSVPGYAAGDVAFDFPALSSAAPSAPPVPAASSSTASSSAARGGAASASGAPSRAAADVVAPASANRRAPRLGQEEFPSLGGGGGGRSKAPLRAPPSPSSPTVASPYSGVASGSAAAPGPSSLSHGDVLSSLFMRPGSAAPPVQQAMSTAETETPQLTGNDFPSLPPGSKPAARAKAAKSQQVVKLHVAKPSPAKQAPSSAASVQPQSPGAAAPSGSAGGGGVSGALKAANKGLVERIKRQLSGSAFATFREQSMLFMRGELQPGEYHDYMVSLGMLSLAAELASLCPDASKRRALLGVHRAFILSPAAQDPGLVGAGWMPPEAAIAKADRVAQHSAWTCTGCGLCNAPDDARCESCNWGRPKEEPQAAAPGPAPAHPAFASMARAASGGLSAAASSAAASSSSRGAGGAAAPAAPQAPPSAFDFPSLPAGPGRPAARAVARVASDADLARADSSGGEEALGGAGPSSGGGRGKKGKGTTIKIGLPTAGSGPKVHPQNVWTQPGFKGKATNSWSGHGAGKVAKMHGAVNDAWDT